MAIVFDDNVKKTLKNVTNLYARLLKDDGITQEKAMVYTLLSKLYNKDTTIVNLLSIGDITAKEKYTEQSGFNISNDDKFRYYSNIKEQLVKLANQFISEYFSDDVTLNINIFEIITIIMIYYPEETQDIFDLSPEKYYLLIEALKTFIIAKYSNVVVKSNKNSKRKQYNGKKVGDLAKYGAENLTAYDYQYNPLVGNEQAIRMVIKKLLGGNSLIILGEAGVGKTTLVRGLAYRIKNGDVPSELKEKQIISIPIGGIVADTQYVGTLEDHIKDIINYAKTHRDTIFHMDEIHMLVGAGIYERSNIDVSNLLKPYISDGTMQIIGATTFEEYDKTIATNAALRRRFRTMSINEPSEEEVLEIAKYYISIKAQETQIEWNFGERLLQIIISLTSSKNRKYYETLTNPNITITLIDDVFASALYYEKSIIDEQDIIEAIKDNEVLSTTKKEELLQKITANGFYMQTPDTGTSRILLFPNKNNN